MQLVEDKAVICKSTPVPPAIDGNLNDKCWGTNSCINRFELPVKQGRVKEQTSVYLAYDKDNLYAGFICNEPDMSKLKTGEKMKVWRNDSIEIMLDTNRDREDYYHLILAVDGSRLQMIGGIAGKNPDTNWKSPWKTGVSRSENKWTAETAIPWSSIGYKPRSGASIRANFARNEQGIVERSSWTSRPGNVLNARRFGNILLNDRPCPINASACLSADTVLDRFKLNMNLRNAGIEDITLLPSIELLPKRGAKTGGFSERNIPAGRSVDINAPIQIPYEPECGIDLWATLKGSSSKVLVTSFSLIPPPRFSPVDGAVLSQNPWGMVWEASAMSKVMADTPAPNARRTAIKVSAARNEYEPFQVVVTPASDLKNLKASVSDLAGPARIDRKNVTVRVVGRVPIATPTSVECMTGNYPDPLLPFNSTDLKAGENTALWFTVYVPKDAASGNYSGTIRIEADDLDAVTVPLNLHVWDFTLPELSYLRTAYGCDIGAIYHWQGILNEEDEQKIVELVNRNFFEHRIAPFNPLTGWRIDTEKKDGKLTVDFSEFDTGASKYLSMFNSFNLPGAFMGGVHDSNRSDPGYEDTKRQFLKQLGSHLREKGWLDKGYCYIYDEPRENDYAKVAAEAKIWREADPGLKILLTEQPEEPLFGSVDIWTPVLEAYNAFTCAERQAVGDNVWWYVCTGPKHPYPNNFIDYPALDHRVLHWMNYKYNVTGVLYWQTTYWQKDPWKDPMKWGSKDETLGNGDGSLLYPATKEPSGKPVIAGPVDSIRWEMIREGVEDYDYLRMLQMAVAKAETSGMKNGAVKQAKNALAQVDLLIRNLADYDKDPAKYMAARRKIAEALESLQKM